MTYRHTAPKNGRRPEREALPMLLLPPTGGTP